MSASARSPQPPRPILIALIAITAVLAIAAVAVLLALLVGPARTVVVANPNPTNPGTASPSPTAAPDPTVTVLVTRSAGTTSTLAITSFTITPTPADCGDPVTAATVPLKVTWTSTGATKATFSINGSALPFTLPASGTQADILQHYSAFAFDCQQPYVSYTLTVSKGTQSAREIIYVAREFAHLH